MTTDTSERGLEELIVRAMTGRTVQKFPFILKEIGRVREHAAGVSPSSSTRPIRAREVEPPPRFPWRLEARTKEP